MATSDAFPFDIDAMLTTRGLYLASLGSGNTTSRGAEINAALQVLATAGGGALNLGRGNFYTDEPIIVPSGCGLNGTGKNSTIIRKGSSFPANGTLVDASGSSGTAAGENHKISQIISNIQLRGVNKTGLLLDISYTSIGTMTNIFLQDAPATAALMRETWDWHFYDFQTIGCGGTSGASDAVIQIKSSTVDKSNLLRFYGARIETFKNCAVSIDGADNSTALSGPYRIEFYGLKMESAGGIVSGATAFISDVNCRNISVQGVYCYMQNATAINNVRYFDVDGTGHVLNDLTIGIGSNVTALSAVRVPRGANSAQGGGSVSNVSAIGNGTLGCVIEVDQLRTDGAGTYYDYRCMQIGRITPLGSTPIIGGSGADLVPIQYRDRYDTASTVAMAGSRNFRASEMNRYVNCNNAAAANMTFIAGNSYDGDWTAAVQNAAGLVTVVADTGFTLVVPPGMSATTNGVGSSVRVRRESATVLRVF